MKQLPLIQINPVNGDRYYVNEYKPSLKYASVTNILAKTVSKSMAYGLGIWRQKQIDIFYRTGRPIFNIDKHKMEFFAKF